MVWWAIVAAFAAGTSAAIGGTLQGEAQIVDGDTLVVGNATVRLNGIDAPELGQKCGLFSGGSWGCDDAAAARLAELAEGETVGCQIHDTDAYGRLVATCFVGETDIGALLVDEGLAWSFVRYDAVYAGREALAKAAGLGLWQGEAEVPWEYRTARWERAIEAAPYAGCPIKGNINAEGERIYHTPWSPWYGRTKIDEAAGERWFCDEAEATTAGWRGARFR